MERIDVSRLFLLLKNVCFHIEAQGGMYVRVATARIKADSLLLDVLSELMMQEEKRKTIFTSDKKKSLIAWEQQEQSLFIAS